MVAGREERGGVGAGGGGGHQGLSDGGVLLAVDGFQVLEVDEHADADQCG